MEKSWEAFVSKNVHLHSKNGLWAWTTFAIVSGLSESILFTRPYVRDDLSLNLAIIALYRSLTSVLNLIRAWSLKTPDCLSRRGSQPFFTRGPLYPNFNIRGPP